MATAVIWATTTKKIYSFILRSSGYKSSDKLNVIKTRLSQVVCSTHRCYWWQLLVETFTKQIKLVPQVLTILLSPNLKPDKPLVCLLSSTLSPLTVCDTAHKSSGLGMSVTLEHAHTRRAPDFQQLSPSLTLGKLKISPKPDSINSYTFQMSPLCDLSL